MWRTRSLFVLVFTGAAVLTVAPPAVAAPGGYVALGDSYSSGAGAGNYYTDGCRLSRNAYPRLWADANSPAYFRFEACGGAETQDVLDTQVQALTTDTRLVTISIGGNDTGWGDTLTTCLTSSDTTCARLNETTRAFIRTTLPGRLDRVYAKISERAPNARVIVLGYPRLFGGNTFCLIASRAKRTAINQSADQLSATIAARAAAHGFGYLDARTTFSTHEVCGSGSDWVIGIAGDGAFHPNASGQRYGYYKALDAIA
jgi:lysophospholipase L1-like esterase